MRFRNNFEGFFLTCPLNTLKHIFQSKTSTLLHVLVAGNSYYLFNNIILTVKLAISHMEKTDLDLEIMDIERLFA